MKRFLINNEEPRSDEEDEPEDADNVIVTESSTKSSLVTKYFTKESNLIARCKKCNLAMNTKYGSTSSRRRHLQSKHPTDYKELLLAEERNNKKNSENQNSEPSSSKRPKQLSIQSMLIAPTWPSTHPSAKQLTRKIGEMIALDMQPYSVVEQRGFINVMKYARPEYIMPSRTTFSRTVVPERYEEEKHKLSTHLTTVKPKLQALSYTTDMWTSRANVPFISLTCHYMTPDFEIKCYCLGNAHFPKNHDAANILLKLNEMADGWNLSDLPEKVPVFMVTDNARNLCAAIKQSNWVPLRCFAHTLQLVICDAKKEDGLPDVIRKGRTIVSHYNQSSKSEDRLHEFQRVHNLPHHNLPQDVPTRWNSEYYMLSRLVQHKVAVLSELSSSNDTGKVEMPTSADWKTAQGIVTVLKPFAMATEEISGESYPTSSLIIPIISQIQKFLGDYLARAEYGTGKTLARNLFKNMKERFPNFQNTKVHSLAMMLDPRFKDVLLESDTLKTEASARLRLEMISLQMDESESEVDLNQPSTSQVQDSDLWGSFDAKEPPPNTFNRAVAASHELTTYLSVPIISRKSDPLVWWRKSQFTYPLLSKLAQRYLAIPATEVTSERQFSTAGNVVTSKRECLSAKHVEEIVFLNKNIK